MSNSYGKPDHAGEYGDGLPGCLLMLPGLVVGMIRPILAMIWDMWHLPATGDSDGQR